MIVGRSLAMLHYSGHLSSDYDTYVIRFVQTEKYTHLGISPG